MQLHKTRFESFDGIVHRCHWFADDGFWYGCDQCLQESGTRHIRDARACHYIPFHGQLKSVAKECHAVRRMVIHDHLKYPLLLMEL